MAGLPSVDGMDIVAICREFAIGSFNEMIFVPNGDIRISMFAFRSKLDGIETVGRRLFPGDTSYLSPYLY